MAFQHGDILVTLPWGEKTLQTAAQQVRSAENRLLMAEKAAALAFLVRGSNWPSDRLREAWDNLLWSQHHDAWITVTTRSGRRAWAFQVASQTMAAEEAADEIIAESAQALSVAGTSKVQKPLSGQVVRLINTTARERKELAEVTLATDRGTTGVQVFDSTGNPVPCQIIPTRRYLTRQAREDLTRKREVFPADRSQTQEQSLNASTVLFPAVVPALGYADYRLEPTYDGGRRRAARLQPGMRAMERSRWRTTCIVFVSIPLAAVVSRASTRSF